MTDSITGKKDKVKCKNCWGIFSHETANCSMQCIAIEIGIC